MEGLRLSVTINGTIGLGLIIIYSCNQNTARIAHGARFLHSSGYVICYCVRDCAIFDMACGEYVTVRNAKHNGEIYGGS